MLIFSIISLVIFMNYLIDNALKSGSGVTVEIAIAIIVGILLILSIIILTIIKSLKDK